MFCCKCGKELPEDAEFCLSCGSKTVSDIGQPKAEQQPIEQKQEQPIEEKITTPKNNNRVFIIIIIIASITVALMLILFIVRTVIVTDIRKNTLGLEVTKNNTAVSELPNLYSLGEFNEPTADSTKFVKVEISIHFTKNLKGLNAKLPGRYIILRDKISDIIKTYPHDILTTVEGKRRLQADIKREINNELKNGQIDDVYFEHFLID